MAKTKTRAIKYVGSSDEHKLVKADFTRHGVDDQGAVTFDAKHDFIVDVSAAAADKLVELDADSFRELTEDEVEARAAAPADEDDGSSDADGDQSTIASPGAAEGGGGTAGTRTGGRSRGSTA